MALKPANYQPVACAVVDEAGNILNMIMADPAVDVPPKGCSLATRPPGSAVDVNWKLAAGKFEPTPELQVKALAEGKALDPVDAAAIIEAKDDDPAGDIEAKS